MGEETEFELDPHLSESTNSIRSHPEVSSFESGDRTHRYKFDFNLKDHETHQKTELLLHTAPLANNTIIHLYKVKLFCNLRVRKNYSFLYSS